MSNFFKEKAHLNIDQQKFADGWERVFGKKEELIRCDNCDKEISGHPGSNFEKFCSPFCNEDYFGHLEIEKEDA
jgi:hypothetical protein